MSINLKWGITVTGNSGKDDARKPGHDNLSPEPRQRSDRVVEGNLAAIDSGRGGAGRSATINDFGGAEGWWS